MTAREPWYPALEAAARDAEADSGVYEVDALLDRVTDAELEVVYAAAEVLHRRSRRLWALRRSAAVRGGDSQSVPRP